MIRTNSGKRRPGTINTIQPKKPTQNQNNQQQFLSYQGSTEAEVLAEINRQQTIKRPVKTKNAQIFCELDLSNKSITNVEKHLDKDLKLAYIKRMDLSHNTITTLPSSIFNKLTNLTEMYIQNNNLQKISFPYFYPNLIRKIDISHNQLSSLNLQHLASLSQLQCQHNQLTFLTLPQNLTRLDCSSNKLSNIYCIQYCVLLEEINFSDNMLYDLKLNFAGRLGKAGSNVPSFGQSRFKYLKYLDCFNNKIQYLEGACNISNIIYLKISNNKLSFTRNIINQLLELHSMQEFDFSGNPIEQAGFTETEIYQVLCTKLESIKVINNQNVVETGQNYDIYSQGSINSAKKSYRSFKDEPYCLFMQTSHKKNQNECTKQWNFTLGDFQQNEEAKQTKINDLSLIEENNPMDMNQTAIDRLNFKLESKQLQIQQDDQSPQLKKLLAKEEKQLKLKVVKSSSSFVPVNHVFYQPYLNALLPMSYVPCEPVMSKGSKVTAKRLDEQHDDFVLISKMFQQKGGVVYVKKITAWVIEQNDNALFNRYYSTEDGTQMGFLLNELNEKSFKELTKFGKLVSRSKHDIIGLQPNVFSRYHIIVRYNPQKPSAQYMCAYLIESNHL